MSDCTAPTTHAMPDDATLLARVAARDPSALGMLYDRHKHAAFGLALRLLGDRAAAEEAVVEAFLTIWRQAGRVKAQHLQVRTWLLTIVYQQAAARRADSARSTAAPAPVM